MVGYDKMRTRKPKLTKSNRRRAIAERDGCVCQFTGAYDPNGSVDHLHPLSAGGKDTWENLAWSTRAVNAQKKDMPLHEFERKSGFKLRKKPVAPKDTPVCALIKPRPDKPDWNAFLKA